MAKKSKTGLKGPEAKARNWYILRLRSLFVQSSLIQDAGRRKAVRDLIDQEIVSMGAESQRERERKAREEPPEEVKPKKSLPDSWNMCS